MLPNKNIRENEKADLFSEATTNQIMTFGFHLHITGATG